jgi:hypothetical protein
MLTNKIKGATWSATEMRQGLTYNCLASVITRIFMLVEAYNSFKDDYQTNKKVCRAFYRDGEKSNVKPLAQL